MSDPLLHLDGERETGRNVQYALMWEDMLRDNLLNFAGTPKGLLLLQQTGAVSECVSYMHSRYARKVQVHFHAFHHSMSLLIIYIYRYMYIFLSIFRAINCCLDVVNSVTSSYPKSLFQYFASLC